MKNAGYYGSSFIEIPKLQDSSDEKDMLVAWTEF